MSDLLPPDEQARADALLAALQARPSGECARCSGNICPHQMVIAHVMGHKDRPVCAACIATGLGRAKHEFLTHALRHITHRACFLQGWEWASERIGQPSELRPAHLFSDHEGEAGDPTNQSSDHIPVDSEPDAVWDAGDMGCGDLVLELRTRLKPMQPGAVLRLTATDPGAKEDIPAWCRMTRHSLVASAHPEYLIRRRDY